LDSLQSVTPPNEIEIYRSLDGFQKRLLLPIDSDVIALLIPAGDADLQNLVALSEFLNGIPVLIVLPDQDPKMVAIAHQLRPRFLTFEGDDDSYLLSVIEKLSKR
jgi:hypothetical protein